MLQELSDDSRPQGDAVDFVEVFAGAAAISKNHRALGYIGISLDVRVSQHHDVLSPVGLVLLLQQVLRMGPGSVLWCAPPCSTWVFMSRGTTKRSKLKPEGDVANDYILAQDALVERLVLVLEVAMAVGAWWIVEQPANTLMWHYPAFQELLQRVSTEPIRFDMGTYGGSSVKPTHLVGTAPYLEGFLRVPCSTDEREQLKLTGVRTAITYEDCSGQKRCQGSKDLKGTQAYPDGLGAQHALLFQAARRELQKSPPVVFTKMRSLADILQQLAPEVLRATEGAWWLRDLAGRTPLFSKPWNEKLQRSRSPRGGSSSASSW